MRSTRKIAVVAGVFFIVTEIAGKVPLAARGSRPGPRGARDRVAAAAPPASRT
ncbi:MAG: hypothetical protein WBF34_00970 [Streptosporangiaceae bacterium]